MTTMNLVTKSLWERYRSHSDLEARQQLLDQYLGLVFHIAGQMLPGLAGDLERDDLVSAGTLGLVLALESFDLSRGLAFSTYATPRIRGAILDELRSRDWVPRSVRSKRRKILNAVRQLEALDGRPPEAAAVAAAMGLDLGTFWRWQQVVEGATILSFDRAGSEDTDEVGLEDMVGDPNFVEPTEVLTREEEITAVRDAIAELPPKQRTVLALYYYEELTLNQIAEILHLTESRISQIRSQALQRLRQDLKTLVEV